MVEIAVSPFASVAAGYPGLDAERAVRAGPFGGFFGAGVDGEDVDPVLG